MTLMLRCAMLASVLVVSVTAQEAYPEREQSEPVVASPIVRAAISPTANRIVLTAADRVVRIVDGASLKETAQIPASAQTRVMAFAMTRSGQRLAAGSADGVIRTYALPAMTPGPTVSAHKGSIVAIAVQDENLAYSIASDRSVVISDILTGATLGSLSTAPQEATSIDVHPDGRHFAVTLGNGTVQLYALAGLKPALTLSQNTARVTASAFSPAGKYFAVGTFDGQVFVWNTADGSLAAKLRPHRSGVTSLAFSGTRTWLASAAADSSLCIIHGDQLTVGATLTGTPWTQVMFGPDDKLLASTAAGAIERWIIRKTPPDADPPVIVLQSPEQRVAGIPHRLYAREIDVEAVVWDNLKLGAVTLNDKPVALTPLRSTDTVRVPAGAASGRFAVRVRLDSIGRNEFVIAATDGAGLTARAPFIVERLSSAEALEVLAPVSKDEVDVVNIPIQFRAWYPVASISVSNNLLPIIRDKALRGKLAGDVITEEIPLVVGYNQVQLEVTGTGGEKISRTIGISRKYTATVATAPRTTPKKRSSTGGPQKWAVVVGVSKYANPGIPSLKFADKDAEAFANFLRTPQGGGYDNEHMRVLLNETATFSALRDALMDFLSNAIDMDLVMIYFAGHGAPDPARPQNLYLLTHDTDPNKLATTAFPMWQIQDVLARYINAKRIVVFSDACHSGGISVNFATRGVSVTEQNLVNQYLADLSRSKEGTVVFTASAAGEVSQEFPEFGHGVFTYYLLDGLKGKADYNNDYTITINEAMRYTEENVKRKTRGAQNPTRSQTEYDKELTVSLISH